jgi:hypothetical protein
MEILIYGLVDPRNNQIRYVGKTKQSLSKRLSQHLWIGNKSNPYKFNWINQLKIENIKPIIIELEKCDENNWVEREKYYINELTNLTNITQGGENGLFFTKEILDKISIGVKKVWDNIVFKENHSKKMKEFWSIKENKIKQSNKIKGAIRTQEHKEILSNIKKEQWCNLEYKENMSKQSKELWNDETYKTKTLQYLKSDEHKNNVSKRFKGKSLSIEHKQKMSDSNKNKKPILIDNVMYESITQASIKIGLNRDLIKGRLKSKNFENYIYYNINSEQKDNPN